MALSTVASRVLVVFAVFFFLFTLVHVTQNDDTVSHLNNTFLRFSDTLRVLNRFFNSHFRSSSPETYSTRSFPPLTAYQRDPRGAIDIFEKRANILCRVYSVCRDRSGQILLPLWMRNHAQVLTQRCALSNFRFVHYTRLHNFPPSPAKYDWLAPNVPTPALSSFTATLLPLFYSALNLSSSKLANPNTTRRTCLAPDASFARNISVCNIQAEPYFVHPAVVISSNDVAGSDSSDFQDSLRASVHDNYAAHLSVFGPSSDMATRSRICFRSLITTPNANPLSGQTVSSPDAFISPAMPARNVSDSVNRSLDAADHIIQEGFDEDDGSQTAIVESSDSQHVAYHRNDNTASDVTVSPDFSANTTDKLVSDTALSTQVLRNVSQKNATKAAKASTKFSQKESPDNLKNASSSIIEVHAVAVVVNETNVNGSTATGLASSGIIGNEPIVDDKQSVNVSITHAIGYGKRTKADIIIGNVTTSAQNKNDTAPGAKQEVINTVLAAAMKKISTEEHALNTSSIAVMTYRNHENKSTAGFESVEKTSNVSRPGETSNTPTIIVKGETKAKTVKKEDIIDLDDKDISTKMQMFDNILPSKADAATRTEVDHELIEYGGIELFTHRMLADKQKNKTKSPNTYGVCRVYRACRKPDSSLLLPNWIKKFKPILEKHCGFSKVTYIPDVEFDVMYKRIRSEVYENKGIDGMLKATGLRPRPNYELDLDLIGTRTYRAQEQHFVTDLFQDALHAVDAVMSHRATNDSMFRRECVYRSTDVNATKPAKYICENAMTYEPAIRPAFVMTDLAKKKNAATKYIRGIVAMVPPRGRATARMLFLSHLSKSGKGEATCFRSIMVTRREYPPELVLHSGHRNVFFEHNRLSRESVGRVDSTRGEMDTGKAGKACRVRLTVLEARQAATQEQRGMIENEEDVVKSARLMTEALAAERGLHGLRLYVRRFKHEGSSVVYASRIMQESEIVLSGNDPALTSIMFTRPQTAVVEVQPFGYSTGPYRNFARSLNLNYTAVMADPDPLMFERCVQDKYKKDWGKDVSGGEMEARMNGLLRMYRGAIEKFNGQSSTLDLSTMVTSDGTIRRGYIPRERVCARAQRLIVSTDKIGRLLAEKAVHICELQLNGSVAM